MKGQAADEPAGSWVDHAEAEAGVIADGDPQCESGLKATLALNHRCASHALSGRPLSETDGQAAELATKAFDDIKAKWGDMSEEEQDKARV